MEATAQPMPRSMDMPAWKTVVSHLGAIVIAVLFLGAGIYKAVDPFKFAALAANLKVPFNLTLPLAVTLAIGETTAGVLVLIPRFRRWGAGLAILLLFAFMGYIGWNYQALIGRDCSCFPELKLPFGFAIDLKRSVGPGFFYGDAAFMLAAGVAGIWARRSEGLRTAVVILGAVAVFTGVSYGVAYAGQSGLKAPDSIVVDGKKVSLQEGRHFLFFYDPECGTCNAVAKSMGPQKFRSDTDVIAIPVRVPQFAAEFLSADKLKAGTSLDLEKLRSVFKFDNAPYAVLIERGRQVGAIQTFDEEHNGHIAVMRQMGIIE
ncbi:MAG: DoxX family protein [Acidobacteriota bacterium]